MYASGDLLGSVSRRLKIALVSSRSVCEGNCNEVKVQGLLENEGVSNMTQPT